MNKKYLLYFTVEDIVQLVVKRSEDNYMLQS